MVKRDDDVKVDSTHALNRWLRAWVDAIARHEYHTARFYERMVRQEYRLQDKRYNEASNGSSPAAEKRGGRA